MQRRRVPVPDRLLPRRLLVDRLQRQRDFDELLLHVSFVHFQAFRTALLTNRRMSDVSTPIGASSTQACAMIAIILFSSSDHEGVPLARASTTIASSSDCLTNSGFRILAASPIEMFSSMTGEG